MSNVACISRAAGPAARCSVAELIHAHSITSQSYWRGCRRGYLPHQRPPGSPRGSQEQWTACKP